MRMSHHSANGPPRLSFAAKLVAGPPLASLSQIQVPCAKTGFLFATNRKKLATYDVHRRPTPKKSPVRNWPLLRSGASSALPLVVLSNDIKQSELMRTCRSVGSVARLNSAQQQSNPNKGTVVLHMFQTETRRKS